MLNLSFMDAVHGVNKDVRIQLDSMCKRCNGKKAEPGTSLKQCPKCRGSGEVMCFTWTFQQWCH